MKKHLHHIADTLQHFVIAHCKTEGIFSPDFYFSSLTKIYLKSFTKKLKMKYPGQLTAIKSLSETLDDSLSMCYYSNRVNLFCNYNKCIDDCQINWWCREFPCAS